MTQEDYINLIFKYLAKTISSDEKILLLKWLEEDKSHRDIFASAAAIRSASRLLEDSLTAWMADLRCHDSAGRRETLRSTEGSERRIFTDRLRTRRQ